MYPKLKLAVTLSLFLIFCINASWAQVGIGTSSPDPSAQLEINSSSKGFLPPRIELSAANLATPVTNPKTGLLVFNTATSGIYPNNVSPGFYYWNGSSWYPVVNKGNIPGEMQYWDGTRWVGIPLGQNNQVLTICGGVPTWGPCPTPMVTLNPINNPYEGFFDILYPNNWFDGTLELIMAAWTSNGLPETYRSCIKFDYSSIPLGAVIDSARLYLYAMPQPAVGNGANGAQYGSSNACYIQRITSNFSLTGFTWNSPPSSTTVNQAIIPQSTSSFQNYIIDVTQLVKDMIPNNNGFYLKLQNEVTYNAMQFASSKHTDPNIHPKLMVYYH